MRSWDVQLGRNWWLSVGFSFDHTDPSLTLHLPGIIISFGRLWQPGFRGAGSFLGLQRDNTTLDDVAHEMGMPTGLPAHHVIARARDMRLALEEENRREYARILLAKGVDASELAEENDGDETT